MYILYTTPMVYVYMRTVYVCYFSSDLVDELQPMIREALDNRKSDAKSARKSLRRFRENLRVRLTKVFELNAFHGCFAGSTSARVENGRLAPEFEEFIDGIRYMHMFACWGREAPFSWIYCNTIMNVVCFQLALQSTELTYLEQSIGTCV